MKPVTDALNHCIQTFVVHKTFKQFKLYLTPSGGIAQGVYYNMVYGKVPERHHNLKSDLLAFNFITNPKEVTVLTHHLPYMKSLKWRIFIILLAFVGLYCEYCANINQL